MKGRIPPSLACLGALLFSGAAGWAQQQVPFNGGIPLAPTGLEARPLPDAPVIYDTAEGMDVRVSVAARGLSFPFSLAFLPNLDMLVTERTGNLRIVRDGVVDPDPVPGVPDSVYQGTSGLPGAVHGLMGIALHPEFDGNQLVYFTYTKPLEDGRTVGLARGRWDGQALVGTEDVFVARGGGGVSRMAFAPDGTIFMTMSGGGPQDPDVHGGKVLRINDDGSVPDDNPFVGTDGYLPEIYSLGHRGSLGLAIHPSTGDVWQNENGPNGGDEINIIPRRRITPGSKAPSCTGCLRSRFPEWLSIPATGCRNGKATCSSAVSVTARSRARASSSGSCSTRTWRSCGARCFWPTSASGYATSAWARTSFSTW